MNDREEQTTYFAKTDFRGKETQFGIRAKDRTRHMYVVGKTGMGKSTLLENMAAQDILNGNGMAFIDPHGSAVETLLSYIPKERIKDVIYFAPFDIDNPISFNIMEDVGYDKRHLVVSGLMSAFKKIWLDQWSSRMEYILTNTLLALIEFPDSTLLDINRMLINKDFRKKVLEQVSDPIVKLFWEDEFAKYTDRYTQEATPAIQNKIGQFVSNPLIRNIVGQPKSSFDFREVMDNKKIVIMNLSKGRMGEQNADLIGSMLIIKIYLSAMSRADRGPSDIQKLPNFYFYVDEFQSFANETFANILSEARKYKLNLTIAHQYIEQMPDEVRSAVFGNVGTMAMFRVGAIDAEVLEKELSPTFAADDLVNLGIYQIYLKLMIDGLTSAPFSATTLPPLPLPDVSFVEEVIQTSREKYSQPRLEVERIIQERIQSVEKEKSEEKTEKRSSSGESRKERPPRAQERTQKPPREFSGDQREKRNTSFKKEPPEGSLKEKQTEVPVSLNMLGGTHKKDTPSSSPNLKELRSALAEALREEEEEKKEVPKSAPESTPQNKFQEAGEKTIPEIPEDKLRKTLRIDE
ncbi:MAG: type IV secretion system DNA-binding domain-containing protein [Candidatus Paceibacterota bacterium]